MIRHCRKQLLDILEMTVRSRMANSAFGRNLTQGEPAQPFLINQLNAGFNQCVS
ncbi:hypothetical protein D3C80_2169750 [compost metagenome]